MVEFLSLHLCHFSISIDFMVNVFSHYSINTLRCLIFIKIFVLVVVAQIRNLKTPNIYFFPCTMSTEC